ncbi:hypothetical protein ASG01_11340 [Chryseobacterium sp. Leaf180]|jgi:hypothetical protein|uniref:hypothetical protein n=1 Tax=Chryseobacterium sp. Leaf180 TaxID=1736289 RepID=UPI0006F4491C|nr:hypothetical protein [Chryseobacterium sp. Leaf180]KQR92505.1 hypothetical protein ASG01_11340 [Chryseobacterium sp. Leaf180]
MNFKITENKSLFKRELPVIHNKNNRQNKIRFTKSEYEETILKWSLSKYINERTYNSDDSEFFPMSSSEKLQNGLTSDDILNYINNNIIFENYEPQEQDFLKIWLEYIHPEIHRKSRPYISNYMSFIYSGEWFSNKGFDHLDNVYEDLFEGEIFL